MIDILKRSQDFGKLMEKMEKEKAKQKYDVSIGAGAIKIVVNGKLECLSVEIDKELLKPEEQQTLQDLVLMAFNEAVKKAQKSGGGDMMEQLKKMMPSMGG
ncbi:MAG: YbaB/EbfC family nucleoid-associated protein [SAR324 cluster bacterium]|nr:YbaB/EbfC family nucleoid-associated protein [SAR324 cluster bacterium]